MHREFKAIKATEWELVIKESKSVNIYQYVCDIILYDYMIYHSCFAEMRVHYSLKGSGSTIQEGRECKSPKMRRGDHDVTLLGHATHDLTAGVFVFNRIGRTLKPGPISSRWLALMGCSAASPGKLLAMEECCGKPNDCLQWYRHWEIISDMWIAQDMNEG